MTTKHLSSHGVGGKSSPLSGLATTQLRSGQVLTSAAVEVLRCWARLQRKNSLFDTCIRFVADTEQTFYREASTRHIVDHQDLFLILFTNRELSDVGISDVELSASHTRALRFAASFMGPCIEGWG